MPALWKAALAAPFLLSAADAPSELEAAMPPVRYQGGGVAIVAFVDRAGIDELCGKSADPGKVIIACHRVLPSGASFIAMPMPCPLGGTEVYATIACHEIGHSLGWSGEHPK